jgi:NADPH-dependent 2,4-dienoyl-CoA reductase/sulfur reductase-like enzyme
MAIPYVLSGAIGEDGARQRRELGHLQGLGVRYLNRRALKVHAAQADGGEVELDDGARLPYDRLLVATGSSPVPPPLPGTDLPGVLSCWTLDDARQIAAKLVPGARVVMLGAGFVAGVCMKSLVGSGARLSVVAGRSGQILRSMMTPLGSGILQRWLESRGVDVITQGKSLRIEPGPRLVMDTRTIDADLIILATGVQPNLSFLEGTGAEVRSGVVVDDHMRTTVPGIYAAGDVAQGRDFSTGQWIVHALQPTATEHGRIAGMNMAGKDVAYRGSLSMNVLDTLGLISHTFGLWEGVGRRQRGRGGRPRAQPVHTPVLRRRPAGGRHHHRPPAARGRHPRPDPDAAPPGPMEGTPDAGTAAGDGSAGRSEPGLNQARACPTDPQLHAGGPGFDSRRTAPGQAEGDSSARSRTQWSMPGDCAQTRAEQVQALRIGRRQFARSQQRRTLDGAQAVVKFVLHQDHLGSILRGQGFAAPQTAGIPASAQPPQQVQGQSQCRLQLVGLGFQAQGLGAGLRGLQRGVETDHAGLHFAQVRAVGRWQFHARGIGNAAHPGQVKFAGHHTQCYAGARHVGIRQAQGGQGRFSDGQHAAQR